MRSSPPTSAPSCLPDVSPPLSQTPAIRIGTPNHAHPSLPPPLICPPQPHPFSPGFRARHHCSNPPPPSSFFLFLLLHLLPHAVLADSCALRALQHPQQRITQAKFMRSAWSLLISFLDEDQTRDAIN